MFIQHTSYVYFFQISELPFLYFSCKYYFFRKIKTWNILGRAVALRVSWKNKLICIMDTSSTKFSLVFLKIIEQHPVNLTNFFKFRIIFRGSFFCSLSDCSRVALRERRRLLLHETSLGDTVPDNTSHILARWQEHPCEMARRSIEVFENM